MRSHAKLVSPLAALASAALHAVLLALGLALSAGAAPDRPRLAPDGWAARTVEVGTIPALPNIPEAPEAPNLAPQKPAAPAIAAAEPRASEATVRPAPSRATPAQRRPPTAAASTAATPIASAGSTGERGVDSAGSIGQLGLPPGVRHLATAFTRALPAGGYRDAAWSELPLGRVGDAVVSLHVTEAGQLETVDVDPEQGLAPALDHMIKRVVLLLKSGTFSLDPNKVTGGGIEHLSVEVTLSTRPANPDELAAPSDLFAQSFAAPKASLPGYARFTLNSGRHVEAVVRFAKSSR